MSREDFDRLMKKKSNAVSAPPCAQDRPIPSPEAGNGTRQPKRPQRRKQMNRTEAEFSLMLQRRLDEGHIKRWSFEELTLRWGTIDPISYTPDFTVIETDGSHRFYEVKGSHIRAKDLQKFKASRNEFLHYSFELWQKKNRTWTQLY